jgi:hypothetical protein
VQEGFDGLTQLRPELDLTGDGAFEEFSGQPGIEYEFVG